MKEQPMKRSVIECFAANTIKSVIVPHAKYPLAPPEWKRQQATPAPLSK
jgi:hypothetical protein